MKSTLLKLLASMAIAVGLVTAQQAMAAGDHSIADHKIVFQSSSGDPVTQNLILNNATNIKKHWGDDVDVVIVAYGPGLSLLTKKNKQSKRIASLAKSGITFDACNNTMKKIEKKTGKKPALTAGVKVVPAGVAEITMLQEKGYSYIRP